MMRKDELELTTFSAVKYDRDSDQLSLSYDQAV